MNTYMCVCVCVYIHIYIYIKWDPSLAPSAQPCVLCFVSGPGGGAGELPKKGLLTGGQDT